MKKLNKLLATIVLSFAGCSPVYAGTVQSDYANLCNTFATFAGGIVDAKVLGSSAQQIIGNLKNKDLAPFVLEVVDLHKSTGSKAEVQSSISEKCLKEDDSDEFLGALGRKHKVGK